MFLNLNKNSYVGFLIYEQASQNTSAFIIESYFPEANQLLSSVNPVGNILYLKMFCLKITKVEIEKIGNHVEDISVFLLP